MSITPQDVPHLTDPNPGNHRIRPQEIGRIVQVLNAHRHPTTTMVDDNAPVETTRDSRESTDGAAPRLRAAEQPSSRLRDTFVGWTGFRGADARTRGLATVPVRELKLRESSQSWIESYPAMDYRHEPARIAQPGRVAWMFGQTLPGLADQVRATGAAFVEDPGIDPVCQLVRLRRVALERAGRRGLDPDHPRSLTRAVELS